MTVTPRPGGVSIDAYDAATPFSIVAERGTVTPQSVWYRDFVLAQESARGLDDRDDHLAVARFAFTLQPGESVTLTAAAGDGAPYRSSRATHRRQCHPERTHRRAVSS